MLPRVLRRRNCARIVSSYSIKSVSPRKRSPISPASRGNSRNRHRVLLFIYPTQGDPHDHHRCPCYAAGCPHRRHSDLDRAATVELCRRRLPHHRRPRWIERHLSFHPLSRRPLSICALASAPAAVIIRGRAPPSSWVHGPIDVAPYSIEQKIAPPCVRPQGRGAPSGGRLEGVFHQSQMGLPLRQRQS